MFFFLSQVLDFIVTPSNLIAVLGVLGVAAIAARKNRLAKGFFAGGGILLLVAGVLPSGAAALAVLEDRFPKPDIAMPVAGFILLGGAVDTDIAADRDTLNTNDSSERITAMRELAERYPDARIVLSGGGSHTEPGGRRLSESEVARRLLVAMGVSEMRIEMEERSRNTCENAAESLRQVAPKPGETWLLITSASHMPRAVACFRAVGFAVTPYPVDYRTRGDADLTRPADSVAVGLSLADLAAHEWIGLLTYRLTGMTQEFFPAPN